MIGRYLTSYGFDPSLNHGALVKSTFLFTCDEVHVVSAVLSYEWKSKSEALTEKSRPTEVFKLINLMFQGITQNDVGPVIGVDYDDRAAYWTRRPGQVAKLQFLIGYFSCAAHSLGCPVIMISPQNVRRLLELPQKGDKSDTWLTFLARIQGKTRIPADIAYSGDARDALILAYLVASVSMEHHNESCSSTPHILSGGTPSADALQTAIEDTASKRSPRRGRQ